MFGSLSQHQIRKKLLAAESEINRAQLIQELGMAKVETEKLAQQVLKVSAAVSSVALVLAALKALRRGGGTPPIAKKKTSEAKSKSSWFTNIVKGARLASTVWAGFKTGRQNGRETV